MQASEDKELIMADPGDPPESAQSTLNLENTLGPDRHSSADDRTTANLGPSDTSDTGSDMKGAPGLARQVNLPLSTGTTSDPEESTAGYTAGPDVGDANLDTDSDSGGSGERMVGGRDQVADYGSDIDVDRIDRLGGIVDPAVDNDVTDDEDPRSTKDRR
jgi:hypothetical protein